MLPYFNPPTPLTPTPCINASPPPTHVPKYIAQICDCGGLVGHMWLDVSDKAGNRFAHGLRSNGMTDEVFQFGVLQGDACASSGSSASVNHAVHESHDTVYMKKQYALTAEKYCTGTRFRIKKYVVLDERKAV